ncbi:MAG: VacJ family lipoprotein [Gallionella sp.]|nr:VacJ family lipoprotein [Gallionella sp.]
MKITRSVFVIAAVVMTGCASNRQTNPADPLEPINRGIYKFNDTLDKAVIKPVARGYQTAMPSVLKTMISNFFSNLDDIDVTANDLLQFKLKQGFSDGMRFVVNSTLGVFGLIDVASQGSLMKHEQDFGLTLGKWGVGNGPYLVLPILGPSTLRDTVGLYGDGFASPLYQMSNMRARNQSYMLRGLSHRAAFLNQESVLEEAMIDPYQFIREGYLLRRKSQIYDGKPPRPNYNLDNE